MAWQWHQQDHMKIIYILFTTDNHASTSSPNFLQAGWSSWCPSNSVKALKANQLNSEQRIKLQHPCTTVSFHQCYAPYLNDLITFCTNDSQWRQQPDPPLSVEQEPSSADVLSQSVVQMSGTVPSKLRVIDSHATFWRALKGHIFNTAISCSLSHWLAFLKDSRSVLMYDWALELFSSITLYDRIDRITTGSQTRRFRLWAKCHNSSTQFCV